MQIPTIDMHAHLAVRELDALVAGRPGLAEAAALSDRLSGPASVAHNRQFFPTLGRPLTDPDARLAAMDAMGVDVQAVSISPGQYYYWADRELASALVRTANEAIARFCATHPDRFVGLATVALQDGELAAEQLEHAAGTLGLRGVEISTAAGARELSDRGLDPFWAAVERLGVFAFVHPLGCPALGDRGASHYFTNVIGNPLETTLALSHLIFDGTLDRHPGLRVCAAHGGGYLPAYSGRSDHAFEVRPEARTMERRPSDYLRERLWFDSLVFSGDQLAALAAQVGASRLVLGTDYPFDMGVSDPLARLDRAGLSADDRELVRGVNAAGLLGL
jgi:aminocarboxymuconate-semialdehyde decarboxylase